MKRALENNCLKGCLIYVVALVALLVLSAVGLGGISARFGGGQSPKPIAVTAPAAPAGQAAPTAALTPTPQPAAPAPAAPSPTPAAPVPPPVQANQPIQASPVPGGDSAPQVQVQGGVISGQASVPFVIVQPGDTLWGIAITYGTKIDALKALNKLGEQFIKPGQVIYLPAGDQTQAPAPVQDVPPPVQPSTDTVPGASGTALPAMPSTGQNARP